MPTNLIDDPNDYPASIVVPDGTDPASSSGVRTPLRQLANRTAHMKRILDTSGVKRIRTLDVYPGDPYGNLRAFTGMVTGQVALLPGYGLYVYNSVAAIVENLPWVLASTAGGIWVHELQDLVYSGQIPRRNRLRSVNNLDLSGTGALLTLTSGSGWLDVPGMAVVVPGTSVGDKLLIDTAMLVTSNDANTGMRVVAEGVAVPETAITLVESDTLRAATIYVVTGGGDVTVKLQVNRVTKDVNVLLPLALRVVLVTP